jgi:hypothetical protein
MHALVAAARSWVQRRRRLVAAACAALAVVLIFGSRTEPAPVTTTSILLQPGEDAVPVQVSGANSLHLGDVLDLVAASDTEPAHVVAHSARVLSLPEQSGWTGSGTTLVVAMSEADSLRAISASAAGSLIPIVHAPAQ